jgi:lipid II isoglutaminyl synthase (glutamine-hydrolysing)
MAMSGTELIVIAHLYPREMNIYGDRGNLIALTRRLEWRGYSVEVRSVEIGQEFDLAQADIIFGGGGQDRGQLLVGEDLLTRGEQLRQLAGEGLPMLLVCGLYQLFGHGFTTSLGEEIPGIGVFDAQTAGTSVRMIGNITLDTRWGRVVGFENHSGATTLQTGQEALGCVIKGYGNQPKGKAEGAITGNAIGTYLHGSLLPKNPALADFLIREALKRKFDVTELAPLDDKLEQQAAQVAMSRPQ